MSISVDKQGDIKSDIAGAWRAGTLREDLKLQGVSRRDFMRMCSGLAAVFLFGSPERAPQSAAQELREAADNIADALGNVTAPNVVWLQLQDCTGCVESVLRSGGMTVENMVLNLLSINYNELPSTQPQSINPQTTNPQTTDPHILVVSGSIPQGDNGVFCTIGGKTAAQVLEEAAADASVVLSVGACAVYGSVQAANPNPTGAVGVEKIVKDKPVINVAGCPPIGEVVTATISYILTHGEPPKVDPEGRPLFAYDQRVHDSCPRRAHYDAGQFVRAFDDAGARNGWCLHAMGCKGPSTFSACPVIQWNMKSSWPIGAGHPCIGCTEKHFFDRFTPFYATLPHVPGLGVEATAEKLGWGLLGAAGAAVAVHGGLTAARAVAKRRPTDAEGELLAAFGDVAPVDAALVDAPATSTDGLVGPSLPLTAVTHATQPEQVQPQQDKPAGPKHALSERHRRRRLRGTDSGEG